MVYIPRMAISRAQVVDQALALADADGIGAVTMRAVARGLGVTPMALYRHVGDHERLIDLLVDAVFAEVAAVDVVAEGATWRERLTSRAEAVRLTLRAHRWAIGLLDARTSPGRHRLAHSETVLAALHESGLDLHGTAHAYALLDSYVYGFALQEATLPLEGDVAASAQQMLEAVDVVAYPHLADFAARHVAAPGYDFGAEFGTGLRLVLDAVGALRGESS